MAATLTPTKPTVQTTLDNTVFMTVPPNAFTTRGDDLRRLLGAISVKHSGAYAPPLWQIVARRR
jgi:predicted PP-loop superfamily ATPase